MKPSKIVVALLSVLFLVGIVPSQVRASDLPTFAPIARGALANDSVYFVMTDRFNNGKSANDEAYVGGG